MVSSVKPTVEHVMKTMKSTTGMMMMMSRAEQAGDVSWATTGGGQGGMLDAAAGKLSALHVAARYCNSKRAACGAGGEGDARRKCDAGVEARDERVMRSKVQAWRGWQQR